MLQNAVFCDDILKKPSASGGVAPRPLPGALPLDPTGGLLRPPDPRIIFLLFHFFPVPCLISMISQQYCLSVSSPSPSPLPHLPFPSPHSLLLSQDTSLCAFALSGEVKVLSKIYRSANSFPCFSLNPLALLVTTELYILNLAWVSVALIQDHSGGRVQKGCVNFPLKILNSVLMWMEFDLQSRLVGLAFLILILSHLINILDRSPYKIRYHAQRSGKKIKITDIIEYTLK